MEEIDNKWNIIIGEDVLIRQGPDWIRGKYVGVTVDTETGAWHLAKSIEGDPRGDCYYKSREILPVGCENFYKHYLSPNPIYNEPILFSIAKEEPETYFTDRLKDYLNLRRVLMQNILDTEESERDEMLKVLHEINNIIKEIMHL